jgi:hypothetical protein
MWGLHFADEAGRIWGVFWEKGEPLETVAPVAGRMAMKYAIPFLLAVLVASPVLWGDEVVYLTDGTSRHGRVEKWDDQGVQLAVQEAGSQQRIVIPAAQVTRIERVAEAANASTLPMMTKPRAPTGEAKGAFGALAQMADAPRNGGASPGLFGPSPDAIGADPTNGQAATAGAHDSALLDLPPRFTALWIEALAAEAGKNKVAELAALRRLEAESVVLPHGMERLDAASLQTRREGFGEWMGRVHADVADEGYRGGLLDVSDVGENERSAMVARLEEKSAAALVNVKGFFPPRNSIGMPVPYRRGQMPGIDLSNAIEVRENASHAVAILAAEAKLTMDLPITQRLKTLGELASANRVLWRARELEPAARMAEQRAAIEAKKQLARDAIEEAKHRARVSVAMFAR